jgi:hypothetical protein
VHFAPPVSQFQRLPEAVKEDRLPARRELDFREGKFRHVDCRARRTRQRRGYLRVIERGLARATRGINQEELGTLLRRHAIPEAVVTAGGR